MAVARLSTAAMHVHVTNPALIDDLVMFLRRMGYVAHVEGHDRVRAFLPLEPDDTLARRDLRLLLRAWEAAGDRRAFIV